MTELADATIFGSSATSLDKLTITNKGNLTITAHGGAVNVDELNQTGSATSTFSGNITISEVVDGFSGKVKISDTVDVITTSSLTIKSAAANKIESNLNMGQGNLSDETKTNKLVINDATGTPYEFDKIRPFNYTGNSFVTVEGIVKTTELSSNDYHILKSAQGLASTTENASLTIDYGAREVAVTGLGNKDKSSLDAKGINLKSGTLKLGNGSDDSTFGTENAPVDFEMSGSSKLNVLGDTVHFGTYTQSENSKASIAGGAGTFNVHGNATLAGNSFTNFNTAGGNTSGVLFHSSLTLSSGDFETSSGAITTVKGTFDQTGGKTKVLSGGQLNVLGETTLSSGEMNLAGNADFQKVFLSGGQLVSSGTTTVAALNQTTDTAALQIKSGTLTAASAALRKAGLNGGKLIVATADLSSADINFQNTATVEIAGLKAGTVSLGKITVDDNSAEKVEGTFAYKGTKAVTINSLKLGDNDQLNFSATNAEKLNLDASKLVAAENSVLNWNVKETSVTGTGGEFKGQMKLADVEGKSDGLKLTISNETFDAAFGNNKGTLDLGKRGTAEGNQHIRNTLNVTGGALDFSSHTSVTGSSVSGDGLITANDGIKLGGKYSGTPELQTSGTLTVGDRNGDFTLGSGSVVTTSGGLAKTQETPAGKVTVKGTLNVMGGESNIGATNLEVAPESGGKGLILSGTEGSVTKLTTTGSLTTSAGGTTVGSHAELNVGTAKANGDAALKVEGGKMIAGSLEAGEKSTSVTNQGSLTVTGGLKATGTDALKVTGTGSSVTTTNLNAYTGSTTVSDGGKLTVTGALNATGVNAVKVTGTGSTLDAQGTLAFDGKVNGESVIAIENDGGMKVKAGHALKKEGDRITSSLSGMIGVAAGSKGFVELDGLSDWINTNFDPSTEAGKKQKLTYREVRDILAALDGDPDKSKLILKLGNVFDWSEYEINLGSENPIDYDEFKKISGVDASTKDLINVNGDVVGNHSWGSATLKPAVGTTPAEEKLKLGSLGENLIDSADDKSGNLTLSKPTDDGYFVKKPTPGNENEGTAGDVELIGSSKSGSDPTVLKLVGTGKIGNVTGAGNKAHTKLTIEGKQDAESNTVTAGDLGNSGNELGELLVDNKVTVNAGDAAAGNVTVQRTSHLNLTGSLTTNAELVNVATDDKPAGDVLVTDKSSLKADSANIAGKLTVEKASSFETHHGAKIAKDLSLDHSSTAEIGGALEVTWGTSLANGSKLTANGDSSLGSLDVLGGSSFDNADKKLKVSKIPVGSETTSGNVFVSGQNSSVKAGSAEIAGALTVKDQATFVATGQGEAGKVSVTGPTQIDGAGSSYLAKGDSAMGDVLVKNGASFGYDQDGQPAGGKLEAKANQPYTAQDGTEKTSNGTVTVTSDNGDRSKLYASKADIAGTLTVNASDVATEGILTVAGETSVIGNGTLLAKGGSTLGELTLSGASSFGYGPAEDGSYTKKEGGKLKTLAGTSYNDADGNLKTSSGDVTVGGSSSLYAEEADIAGSLTVKETSIFETKETAKIAKDLTLDNAKADFGSALTVTVNGTLTNGAELKANGDSSLGSLDVSGASKFDIGNKKLTAIHNEQTSGDVVVKGNGSSVVAGEADIQGLLSVSDNATFKTTSATGVSSGDVNVASSATINKGIVEVGGDFRAAGELKLSNSSNLSVNQDAVANGLTVDASIASVGGQLTVDSPHLVLVKNGGALSAGNALLNEVKVENDPENAIKTNKLSFGKEGGSGTRIETLHLAGNTELTFNASSDSSTDANVNVVKDLTVASGVNATINGIAAQYGAIALNGNLDAEKAILTAREGQGSLQVEGNADTPALARFGELDLAAASSGSVKNGLLAVGGQEALEANIESLKDEAKAALKSAKQSDVDVSSILYVNSALSAPNGTLTVGETTGMQFGNNTFGIGTGGFMILDRGAMDEPVIENGKTKYTAQLTGNIVNNGKMMFKNVKISGGTVITLADGNHTVSGDDANFLSGNFLYDARLTGNNLTFTMSETGAAIIGESLSESLQEMVMDLAEGDGFDSSRRDGAGWIASVMEDVTGDGNRTPDQIGRDFGSALESASRMTTQSGTFLVTDTVKHVAAGSVEERLGFSSAIGTSVATEETFGRTLWATPLYNKTKADAFKAGNFTSGSDVDLYGITVGADVVVRDDTRLGAALYAGSGKADSRGSLATTKNDFDFYGAALYFGHSAGAWSFMGDMGFGYVTNDVKQTNHGVVKADMDSTVFTASLKAKYAFAVGGMQVAPFAGLRLNHVDSKNYSAKTNAQGTILDSHGTAKSYAQVPLGVQLSRDFMTQTGWTMKPALDLAVTPVLGSKNLTETIRFTGVGKDVTTSSEVLDRVRYSAVLGVSGGKDKVGFGVSVGYSGSKNTDAFAVKANVRWTF
ncbi:MAG: autotransporter domain-containing protein [Duodenibacillus sp.]|nr:autotransporter domain-containing protein [Duodenibacillus sp.]